MKRSIYELIDEVQTMKQEVNKKHGQQIVFPFTDLVLDIQEVILTYVIIINPSSWS